MDASQMKIHMSADGVVELSVSLNGTVDPSVVATMVAAVRAGVVGSPPPSPATLADVARLPFHAPPPPQRTPSLPRKNAAATSPRGPASPQLQPAPPARRSAARPAQNPDRPPSPLVYAPIQKLSVRQLAAELESQQEADRLPVPSPYRQFDPVREFSSSPALWLTGGKPSPYVENVELEHISPPGESPPSSINSSRARPRLARRSSSSSRRPSATADRRNTSIYPEKVPDVPAAPMPNMHPFPAPDAQRPFSNRPIRMLSLPSGTRYEHVNDMYFGDGLSSQDLSGGEFESRNHVSAPTAAIALEDDVSPASSVPILAPKRRGAKSTSRTEKSRSPGRRDRPFSHAPDPYVPVAHTADHFLSREADHEPPLLMQRVPSHSPLHLEAKEDDEEAQDPEDAWEDVEYVLTEEYRDNGKTPHMDARERSGRTGGTGRSAAWRLLSSIGASFSRKKPEHTEDIHQSTLAHNSTAFVRNEKPSAQSRLQPRRNRGHLFGRHTVNNGGLWLEFSSPLNIERMLAEVGKIAKTMGYQVWRRPGENKLRCIRQLSQRHEMHMVILVGTVRIPEGPQTVVRLRRARGDRNRTEWWRYSHFYREVIDRLRRCGIDISAEV